ncbi:MAG: hypothetical protein MJ025_05725 [Victivallaceae bacterium]|nr:hypothetical protein [Victivallaceae bacterium]
MDIVWHGCGDFSAEDFDGIMAGAKLVKANPVRQVFCSGEYFIKIDRRRGKSFRGEYLNARFLEERGVPVVPHVAYGRCELGNILVTRAVGNSAAVSDYIGSNRIDYGFLRGYVDFLKLLRDRRIRHSDLHDGNILYVPAERRFLLVDVKDVHRHLGGHRISISELARMIVELREQLTDAELCELLAECGAKTPERVLSEKLSIAAKRLRNSWGKRRRQILSGYRKFTRIDGDRLLDPDVSDEEITSGRRIPGTVDDFLTYHYLRLARIPVRRVLGFDPVAGVIIVPKEGASHPVPGELLADFASRARIFGFDTVESDWCGDADRPVYVSNLGIRRGQIRSEG